MAIDTSHTGSSSGTNIDHYLQLQQREQDSSQQHQITQGTQQDKPSQKYPDVDKPPPFQLHHPSSLEMVPSLSSQIFGVQQSTSNSHLNTQFDFPGQQGNSSQNISLDNRYSQPQQIHRLGHIPPPFKPSHQAYQYHHPANAVTTLPFSNSSMMVPTTNYPQQYNPSDSRDIYLFDQKVEEGQSSSLVYNTNRPGLMPPIPPLHLQQQTTYTRIMTNDTTNQRSSQRGGHKSPINPEDRQTIYSTCTRCKKEFDQTIVLRKQESSDNAKSFLPEPKIFKLCQHCRDLQRQRSRRWQQKTKERKGVCRRCGVDIPIEEQRFVLCPQCRQNLRERKANRAAHGRCVHCSGPLTSEFVTNEYGTVAGHLNDSIIQIQGQGSINNPTGNMQENIKDEFEKINFKVCQRCRTNDKIRRGNLERLGACNRCAKPLDPQELGRHKVCAKCRNRKKRNLENNSIKMPFVNEPSNVNNNFLPSLPNPLPPSGYVSYESNVIFANGSVGAGSGSFTGSVGLSATNSINGPDGFMVGASYNSGFQPSQMLGPYNLQPFVQNPTYGHTIYAPQAPQTSETTTAQYLRSHSLHDQQNNNYQRNEAG